MYRWRGGATHESEAKVQTLGPETPPPVSVHFFKTLVLRLYQALYTPESMMHTSMKHSFWLMIVYIAFFFFLLSFYSSFLAFHFFLPCFLRFLSCSISGFLACPGCHSRIQYVGMSLRCEIYFLHLPCARIISAFRKKWFVATDLASLVPCTSSTSNVSDVLDADE